MEAFNVAKKSLKELKIQLSQFENERNSATAALEGAERQAENVSSSVKLSSTLLLLGSKTRY